MSVPRLTLVTDRVNARMFLPRLAREAIAGGVDIVQIRERDLDGRELGGLVSEVVEAVGAIHVAVNNAPAIAAKFGIHLHLPERAMSGFEAPAGVRSLSCSAHSVDSLRNVPGTSTYLIAGHLYPTASHAGLPPLGATGFRAIVTASPRPVVAIGGITPENADEALAAGAAGIAVVSYVNSSLEPKVAARELRDVLERCMDHQATAISIHANGKPVTIDTGTSLTAFLEERNLHPRLVVVERNREIVAKSAYDSTVLEEGDLLEIAHFVGGG